MIHWQMIWSQCWTFAIIGGGNQCPLYWNIKYRKSIQRLIEKDIPSFSFILCARARACVCVINRGSGENIWYIRCKTQYVRDIFKFNCTSYLLINVDKFITHKLFHLCLSPYVYKKTEARERHLISQTDRVHINVFKNLNETPYVLFMQNSSNKLVAIHWAPHTKM